MAEHWRFAVAVLAAGQSRRFGPGDKLAAGFGGGLLGEQACHALAGLDLSHRWVIAAQGGHPCSASWQADGFTIALNPGARSGMGSSVALAAHLALEAGAKGLLIALADMPLVPADHFRALVDRATAIGPGSVVASEAGGVRLPPAVFGCDHFAALSALRGDQGARALLDQAETVACAPQLLIDVDDEQALRQAQASALRR